MALFIQAVDTIVATLSGFIYSNKVRTQRLTGLKCATCLCSVGIGYKTNCGGYACGCGGKAGLLGGSTQFRWAENCFSTACGESASAATDRRSRPWSACLPGGGQQQRGLAYALTHTLAEFGERSLLLAYHPSVEVVGADACVGGVLFSGGGLCRHVADIAVGASQVFELLFEVANLVGVGGVGGATFGCSCVELLHFGTQRCNYFLKIAGAVSYSFRLDAHEQCLGVATGHLG